MLILEGQCPKCKGNLILDKELMSLTCEECEYSEETKDKRVFAAALEGAEEWGSKENRLEPSEFGKLILNPRLEEYARDTLEEAMRGFDLEPYDEEFLKKFKLIKEDNNA